MRTSFVRLETCVFLAAFILGARARAEDVLVLFTADNAGSVGPCPACPERTGEGGLARRATAVSEARSASPGLFLLDAGDAFHGPESIESHGKVIVAAYNALAYDAVNLTFRDFRGGKAAALALLEDAGFAVVSANLLDSATGSPLAKPFVVLGAGDRKIAVIGLSELSAGQEHLPHLKTQLEGVRVRHPVEALREWLPAAGQAAPRVILLYHGSRTGLGAVLDELGDALSAVIVGGLRPEHVPGAARPGLAVVGTADRGRQIGRVSLGGPQGSAARALDPIPVKTTLTPDSGIEALAASFRSPVKEIADVPAGDARSPAPAGSSPAEMEAGRTYRLDLRAENRGASLTVLSAVFLSTYGNLESGAGRKLLLLDTEWENIIPLTVVEVEKVPTEYRIPNLADYLYLVVNGSRLERLLPEAGTIAGHLPVRDFRLERIGSRIRANVIFSVPADGVESLDLRFYDYAHGHIAMALRSRDAGMEPAAKPVAPPQRNEVLEAAVYGLEKLGDLDGRAAPAGMEFLAVDFRARSLFLVDGDATAFDPKARPGARRMIGTVADWLESRKYVQLLADGEIAYSPLPESTLAGEPRFLPDIPTGGRLVFLGPAMRASLELRCDFPNAKSSLDGQVFRPRGITIPLEGKRPGLQAAKALVSVTDDAFEVSVTGVAIADELAGRKAEEGKRFITLEVTVRNTGKQGELFQTSEQLKLALSDGALLPIDAAALESLRPPLPLLWIPPGERRTFQAAYRAPVIEAKLRLAYSGVSLQKMLDLPLPGPAPEPATVVAAPVKAPDAPEAKPRSPAEKPLAKRPEPPGEAQPAAQLPAPAAVPTPPAATQPVAAKPDAATPAAKPERDPRGLAGVGLTPEKVNESIDRGAAFLWRHLKEKDLKNGRKLGGFREHTISALALVHSGAHRKYPDLDAALREYLPAIDLRRGDVYEAGITCMLVEAYEDPSFLPTLRAAVRYILEIQGPEGSWTYSRRLPEDILRDPAEDRVIQVTGGVPLDGSEASAPVSRATPWKDGVDGDNSVSQYALLGLQSASRAGVRVDAEVWERSLASFRARQGDDGNWSYHTKSTRGYGSMTCAGICSIAIARHEWGEKDPAADPAVEKGLRWIGANFSLEKHPQTYPPERWRFYYLYSLERVGRVLGLDFIGEHEWYPEGAKHLVSTQLADGSWVGDSEEKDPRLATSFALLFLTRSTPSLKPQEVKRGGSGILKTGLQLPRGNRYYVILDASGSMLAEMDGKSKWQIARDAVAHLVEDLADNSEVALRVYGHRKRAIDQGASDDTALEIPLRPLVKKDFLAKLDSLRPRGKTPLARSLLEAKRDLGNAAASDPVTVILLTDGGEDTLPRQDPVRAAAEFGLLEGVRLHVVGFDIGREEWSAQLRAIAGRARGSYWPALQAESLYTELRSAVFGVPAGFAVLDPAGKEAASGPFGKEISLPEGRYVFQTRYGGAEHAEGFWINTDRATSVVFNAARVAGLRPVPGDAGPAANAKPAPRPGTKPGAAPGDTKPAPEKPKPMFCTECGKPMKSDAKFCTECGAKVKG